MARGYDGGSSSCWRRRRRRRRRCVHVGCCTGRTSGGLVGAAKISCRRGRSMNTRYTHTARGRLVWETRAASPTVERREKKSINNTDYWFWHRRWRGGRHCTVVAVVIAHCIVHRARATAATTLYPSAIPRHPITLASCRVVAPLWRRGELIAEKPNLLGKSAENIIRRPWRCCTYIIQFTI